METATGAAKRLIVSTQYDSSAQYSPDGKLIAFRSSRSGSNEIWIASAAGGSERQLTNFNFGLTGTPRWSPDSREIAFDSRPEGQPDILRSAWKGVLLDELLPPLPKTSFQVGPAMVVGSTSLPAGEGRGRCGRLPQAEATPSR